ncbi:hypothetical protein ACFPER_05435 [Agromyces aurantiacus]|uniref:Secreted protein n=1 Tax=Agromyces aurantiacus TaxID=165814 RepID=A0ABV9R7D6_9MICO|nr:hypothetical protein [Agromyces aurantiacus]MBM7502903.1 hypothetical protein [Agromyces aurantiacus]
MKRILATGFIVGLATVGLAAVPAQAAPNEAACFGGVHKLINTEGYAGFTNVGQVVQALGGQGKNDTARGICGD